MPATGLKNQGTKWFIGTQATNPVGDTYVQIKRCTNVGPYGPEAQVVDATALEDLAKEKLKGIPDYGNITLRGRRLFDDAGQNALKAAAALDDDDAFNFQCRVPAVRTTGGTPDHLVTLKAVVTQFKDNIGGVDGLIEFEATIAVSGVITEAAAAAA